MKKITMSMLALLVVLLTGLSSEQQGHLSELRVFNRVILLAKEQYVEPSRFDPQRMLLSSLDAIEQKVPEIVISEPSRETVLVQVGKKSKTFPTTELNSLWDMSFRMRDITQFIEDNVTQKKELEGVEYAATNGMLKTLDPHSMLLEPKYSTEMKVATKGEFGGLGVVIGLRDGFLTVISPLEGTPAFKAGVKALDRIVKIDQDSTINLGLDEAVEKMRGKPGTKVNLEVLRKGATHRISMLRSIIKVDSVNHELLDGKYGYIKIKAFHGNTTHDVKAAIDKLKTKSKGKLAGLILDFRNNPGGLLDQSVSISDLFLDGGTVVITQGSVAKNRDEEHAAPGTEKTKMPLVVLVNNGSASASEIVAGAIKNRGRGIVIGEQTFGKGSVQMLYDFPDKSSLKMTIAQYLTPGEESIQSVGITPDVLLRPMYAEDKTAISLFPESRMREQDLEAHLDDAERIKSHKPSYELAYVSKRLALDETERRNLSSKFQSDFEINFAQKVLAQTKSSSRQDLLMAAGAVVKSTEQNEAQNLISSLAKLGIDWVAPSGNSAADAKLTVSAKLLGSATVKAGETLNINLSVTNTSKVPLYQVYGISDSATSLFEGKEFLYGKLLPGKKRTWNVEIKIPKDVLTRRDLMRVAIKGSGNQVLSSLDIPISILSRPNPVLSYKYELLAIGNKVDVVVTTKNIGEGVAEEPWVLLKNMSGADVFVDEGRQKLKALKPGESAQTKLSFTLRNGVDAAKVQLQVSDVIMGEFWGEELKISLKELANKKVIERVPPQIEFAGGAKQPIVAGDDYQLSVKITDNSPMLDAIMFVNDQKVLYQPLSDGKGTWKFSNHIKLKPGVNVVSLMAREDENYGQRGNLTIFSTSGDPVAKEKTSTH